MTYDERMDQECIPICDALNALPGIRTFESCCGHEVRPFCVYFTCNSVRALKPLLRAIYARRTWSLRVACSNVGDWNVYFVLEGLPGIYKQANEIAAELAS